MGGDKKHFVLVHGSCHGAWCWYKLVPLLKMAGHSVTALDLGGGGVNPKRLDEIASISDHLQPLMDFMDAVPQDQKVILVGHSYGGFAISLAMESFPEKIAGAVFVAAFMPNFRSPPASIMQQYFKSTPVDSMMDVQFLFDRGQENPPTSIFLGPKLLETKLYNRCQQEDLELANMLVRRSGFFLEDLAEESVLTEGKFGSLNRVYVVSEGDQLLSAEYQRWCSGKIFTLLFRRPHLSSDHGGPLLAATCRQRNSKMRWSEWSPTKDTPMLKLVSSFHNKLM